MRAVTLLVLAGCHGSTTVAAPDAPESYDARDTVQLTVHNGYGTGSYHVDDVVQVWANVDPKHDLLTAWTGDAVLPKEWHTTFVMPAHDVTLTAVTKPITAMLRLTTYTGSTTRPKRVDSYIPPNPRGLVMMFHGTGGSADFITTPEAFYVAQLAIEHGYGVLGTEAEEVVAGDLNGDGNIRWTITPTQTNTDLTNLDMLIAQLQSSGAIATTTPLYALGMSNGGSASISLGAISASPVAATFPRLTFRAVISHCADGPPTASMITTTPTAWRQCARDDNPQVDNAAALINSHGIAARGIASEYVENPPSPLYDQRFMRTGLDVATSTAIANELRAAGFTDAQSYLTTSSTDIQTAVHASPSMFPTLSTQTPAVRKAIVDQLRAMEAVHQMYSDLAARDLAWFEAH